jgi:hypothetical protein
VHYLGVFAPQQKHQILVFLAKPSDYAICEGLPT